ncbi:MAG TPA: hypothetical protein VMH81_10195 [Bryobacteraceae bacterium]|nr:hypothetical protein [Bryobacteraceae bacterium]
MELTIGISVVIFLALAMTLPVLLRKIGGGCASLPVTAEWIDELSVERYRPMMRLLDGEDLDFMRSQPGFTPKMATRLRVQRCKIFLGYLRCLNEDFRRVSTAIKILLVQSRNDRPDLATALLRYQASFAAGMTMVYFRLALFRFGLCSVDVTSVVQVFDRVSLELRTLVPVAQPMGA